MKKIKLAFILVITIVLFACGSSSDSGKNGNSGANNNGSILSNCNQSGYDIYLGYYVEDANNNPEDPTAGYLMACMPDSNAPFSSELLFSYEGCQGGVDVGNVSGNRNGNNINGTWSGTVDGRNIGGEYSGIWDGSKFTGTWNNNNGKTRISSGSCAYYVARDGTWVLFGLNTDNGGVNPNVSGGQQPTITWNNSINGATGFMVSVYDKQCMYDKISIASCTKWSVSCDSSVSSLSYGQTPLNCQENSVAQTLQAGTEYVLAITALETSTSNVNVLAFATTSFTAQ